MELPLLVDLFVDKTAKAASCTRSQLRQGIAVSLGLEDYDSFGKVCRMMGEVYPLLINAFNDVEVDYPYNDAEVTGLAAALVSAWYEAEEIGGLANVDPEAVDPVKKLPWRIWASWNGEDLSVEDMDGGTEAAIKARSSAYDLLDEFIEAARSWRQQVLDAYTLVNEGTPLPLSAVEAAEELLEEIPSRESEKPEDRLRRFLSARGFDGAGFVDWGKPVETDAAEHRYSQWMLKRHEKLVERVVCGESLLQVRELRNHFRWFPRTDVSHAYEDGPCMSDVLARLNDDSYILVTHSDQPNELTAIVPYDKVYVEREGEIAEALRCSGVGGIAIKVVDRSHALEEGLPHIAGWYCISLWE
ncbi:hypothetical protein [Piscinibacter gummiphilus]|uniref:Uncharacterized protein n=1 Tax=Piscinibacter gummiphilus TaxID=946333 RepID=A0ABZ0D206_9BURK|nr:hypothetical protein [Piscinibacter gummiphilus]WOB11207.1 hypothetical protein RXV79_26605 [Piscinibacter gummiphilus]